MIRDFECPVCDTEFEADIAIWSKGKCPKCGNECYLSEECTEDYSDCWITVEWQYWKKPEDRK